MNSRVLLAAVLSGATLVGFGLETTQVARAASFEGRGGGPVVGGGPSSPVQLLPRRVVRKPSKDRFYLPTDPVAGTPWYTGNIVLKFKDDVRARAARTDSPMAASLGGVDLGEFSRILANEKLTVRQWINRTPAELAALETRALNASGRAQPDLAGMMIIENVDPDRLVDVAWRINALPEVEFANIERIAELHQCGPEAPGPCNVPGPSCDGEGFNCNPDPGNQFNAAEFGCLDANCCGTVAALIPYCNDQDSPNGWDIICAAYANVLCQGTVYDNQNPSLQPPDRYDPCFYDPTAPGNLNPIFAGVVGAIQQGCFDPHPGHGCSKPACCNAVCTIDPACCAVEWDQNCVNLATSPGLASSCLVTPDPGPTPDFLPFPSPTNPALVDGYQLYLQNGRADPDGVFPRAGTWSGRGFDLSGFTAVQEQVSQVYLGGVTPNTRGAGTRVAIIEFSAFVLHEDFILSEQNPPALLDQPKVIAEPGQTIVLIEGSNNAPQHGTATLGEVVSADNGFGVTGIATNAQGYFFPIISVEEGFRAQNAITSCFEEFEAGDAVNHSWGSPPDFPLPSIEQYYVLFGLGTDLGITTVCSAGNSNCAIQPQPGEIDCGAIVVGASSAGRYVPATGCPGYAASQGRYLRMPFSNYSGDEGLSQVHVMAWGDAVTTTGYGDLFLGQNPVPPGTIDPEQANQLRMYTSEFNGTSSAAPMITGCVSLVQAYAKQVYGFALPPTAVRSILSGNAEAQSPVAVSPENCPGPLPDCCLIGDPDCEGIFKNIGPIPRMYDVAVGVFTGIGWDGSRAEIEVIAGTKPLNAAWASLLIRAEDGMRFRINSVPRTAGQTAKGLTYLTTGFATDVIARLQLGLDDPQTQLNNLGLTCVARATRGFVMLGAFIKNFQTGNYEFFGADFVGTVDGAVNFEVPNFGATGAYVNPENNKVEFRLWSVGLGTTRAYEFAYDLIEIRVNDPFNPL